MKMPKTLDNLFNNIYFLYFVSFLAVFNLFAYIIMNNFNAIILFILIGYITYLFSKNMAIVLIVALLITNLFMSSNNNRMGREGFRMSREGFDVADPNDADAGTNDTTDPTGAVSGAGTNGAVTNSAGAGTNDTGAVTNGAGAVANGSGNRPVMNTAVPGNLKKSSTSAPAPAPASMANNSTASSESMQNLSNMPIGSNISSNDMEKMQHLLTSAQSLMKDLKGFSIPGMPSLFGN